MPGHSLATDIISDFEFLIRGIMGQGRGVSSEGRGRGQGRGIGCGD